MDKTARLTQEEVLTVANVVIDTFRELDPEAPALRLSVLLHTALNDGVLQKEVPQALKASDSAVSRHTMDLTHRNRANEPGLDLVAQRQDPMYRRRNVLELTSKGRRLIETMTGKVNKALDRR